MTDSRPEAPALTGVTRWVGVYDGQWVIRGVRGELYPIAEDVLAATYEPADAHPMCPGGCGCRPGTDDADRRECGCDGGCCGD